MNYLISQTRVLLYQVIGLDPHCRQILKRICVKQMINIINVALYSY